MSQVRGLDGVRALSVAAVFSYHAHALHCQGGWLGVDVFFSVSGFLITLLLLREHETTGRIDLLRFYARRVRRLWPALFFMFAALSVVFALHPSLTGHDTWNMMPWVPIMFINWQMVLHNPATTGSNGSALMFHLWTLGVEEQFYLVWPLALVGLLRGMDRRILGAFMALLGVGVSLYAIIAWHHGLGSLPPESQPLHDRLFWGSDTHSAALIFGCAVALFTSATKPDPIRSRWVVPVRLAAVASVVFLIAVAYRGPSNGWIDGGGLFGIAVAAALVVGGVAVAPGRPVLFLLEWPPLAFLGRISYGFYLWSIPMLSGVAALAGTGLNGLRLQAVQFLATAVAATASFFVVERPVIRALRLAPRESGPSPLSRTSN